MGAVISTALSVAGVFLVALSPLLIATVVTRALHWVGRRGGRHRRRGPAATAPDHETIQGPGVTSHSHNVTE